MREEDVPAKTTRQQDGSYICNTCSSEIMVTTVAHAIHDGPFPLSGSGRCEYEDVPYCPKCETRPNFHGTPIKKPFGHNFW